MAEIKVNQRKVAMIGCGYVGAATAFALMESGLFSEMVLIDVDRDRAEGEALDIAHGMPLASPANIYAGDYADIADAGVVIITAGVFLFYQYSVIYFCYILCLQHGGIVAQAGNIDLGYEFRYSVGINAGNG